MLVFLSSLVVVSVATTAATTADYPDDNGAADAPRKLPARRVGRATVSDW